ncbi:MAG TPA: class I adenylate-forming enzyme family protein [Solirubrobacteraceae bacterium]|nr:class I adenylate-forming enzyme family protein [Solirubrobacteraceae bacterium]
MRIQDAYEQYARYTPDRRAVVGPDRSFTWSELYDRTGQWGAALRGLGLAYGDVVATVAGNSAEFLALFGGAAGVGIAVAPVNPALRGPEMAQLLEVARPQLVLAEEERMGEVEAGLDSLEISPRLHSIERVASDIAALAPLRDESVTGEEPFTVYFTSGTTGRPKGVFQSQNNAIMDGLVMGLQIGMTPADDLYLFLPLFHSGGYHSAQLALLVGGTVSVRRGFDPADLERSLRGGVTVVMGVPAVWTEFIRNRSEQQFDSLRIAYVAGSMATIPLIKQLHGLFPRAGVVHAYGLTECGFVTALRPEESTEFCGSIGRPLPGLIVEIHDMHGVEVPVGTVGEIVIRDPPAVMSGYWNDPDTTAAAFRGPWLRTGDLGRADDTGHLYIVGRSKELIISKGENIAPAEIEAILGEHPAVHDCAVLGMPDPEFEEMVVAAVELTADQSVSAEELIEYVAERVSRFKRPRRIFFVDGFPRTSLGKISKPELAKRLFTEAR